MSRADDGRSERGAPRCCCGSRDCAVLRHNCSLLEAVEKDVHAAAVVGKALLARHEAYMADAERDRSRLTARVDELEAAGRRLEAANRSTVDENRALLDQLAMLNAAAADSDLHMRDLETALLSSQQTCRRLEGAASRASDLERQLALLDDEQLALRASLESSESETRSAVQRWRLAERGIIALEEQLERMEKEASDEKARHCDVLDRMRKQHALEKDLDSAAGRLKGAAAARSLADQKAAAASGSIVSHFVKDLLQDNANLQLGMAELRDMLATSNDEIHHLREQLMFHQPVARSDSGPASTLRAELELQDSPSSPSPSPSPSPPPAPPAEPVPSPPSPPSAQVARSPPSSLVPREVHIHHHYHAAKKPDLVRKLRRKRQGLASHIFAPPHLALGTSPFVPGPNPAAQSSASTARMSTSTAASNPSHRWSVFSDTPSDLASSVPSSPQSSHRNSLFFDKSIAVDSSAPASPTTSIDPLSPTWRAGLHDKRGSDASMRSFQSPVAFQDLAPALPPHMPGAGVRQSSAPSPHPLHISHQPIREEAIADDGESDAGPLASDMAPTNSVSLGLENGDDVGSVPEPPPPPLRRTVSHESIMSLSGGLDIHTLSTRPSQLALRPLGAAPVVGASVVNVTASRPRLAAVRRGSSAGGLPRPLVSRLSAAAVGGTGSLVPSLSQLQAAGVGAAAAANSASHTRNSAGALGKLVAWRPWGAGASSVSSAVSPWSTVGNGGGGGGGGSGSAAAVTLASAAFASAAARERLDKERERDRARAARAAGINQPGEIPGFSEYWAAHHRPGIVPSSVFPISVDEEALREGLLG